MKIKTSFLNRLINSEFNKSLATVFSGTAIGTVIPIISMIFLARIYDPISFGILAVYEGLTNIIIHVSTGKYELAIFNVHTQRKYIYILLLVTAIAICVSFVSMLILLVVGVDPVLSLLVSLGIVVNSLFLVSSNILIKNKEYKRYTKLIVGKSIIVVIVQAIFFYFSYEKYGLVVGIISGFLFFSVAFYFSEIRNIKSVLRSSEIKKVFLLAREFIEFPKFSIFSNLVFSAGNQAPVFFLSYVFSLSDSGNYAQARRNIDMPTLLLANSIGHVYKERFSQAIFNVGNFYAIFISTVKKLIVIGLVPCLIIFLFGEDLFLFVLGDQWGKAGQLASILSLVLFARFIYVPISYTYSIIGKQRVELYWQLLLAIAIIGALCLGWSFKSVEMTVRLYAAFSSLIYLCNILYLSHILRKMHKASLYENEAS